MTEPTTNDHRSRETYSSDQIRARDAVRRLGRPAAEPAFRARLRAEFRSGTIAGGARDRSPSRVLSSPAGGRTFRRRLRLPLAALSVAAAVVLLLVYGLGSSMPPWQVVRGFGDGEITVDGERTAVSSAASLEYALDDGVAVSVSDRAGVEILCPRMLALQASRGCTMTLPSSTGRWFRSVASSRLDSGVLRLATGPMFQGHRMRLETPILELSLHGTAVAVTADEASTVVSVLEGEVEIRFADHRVQQVPAGIRRTYFADLGRDPLDEPLASADRQELSLLLDQAGR